MEIIVISLICYLIGSIPVGFILTKFFLKKDIRKIGSGNIGATNVLRAGNKSIGYSTLILDILKAVIPVLFTKFYILYDNYVFISAFSVFIGHVFPIWLKFKGGKGVATYLGILFCINYLFGLIFICFWLIIFVITKFSSLASIIASLSIPVYLFFLDNVEYEYFYIIMFVLIFYTHRENIKRLINQEESKTKIY
jgi:glycerol-3-phosphate acyltransferase PlsY